MSHRHPSSTRDRFLKGADAWINSNTGEWQGYWLAAPCCLLEHAHQTGCQFDDEVLDKLALLEATKHEQVASLLYAEFLAGGRSPGTRPRDVFNQAAQLMEGMIRGVRAAMALAKGGPWESTSPPDDFVEHAVACCEAYQAAWPLGASDPGSVVQPGPLYGAAALAPSEDLAAVALQAVVAGGHCPNLRVATWLAVRHLLDYVLPRDSSATGEPVKAPMLAYLPHVRSREETRGEGLVCDVHAFRQVEGHFGFYLDPVAMGLTLVDPSMITSLDLAWRACRPEIQKRMTDSGSHALPAIRLSPHLSGGPGRAKGAWQLSGDSAGGLFACAMYAAATGTRLNTDASASVALRLRDGCSPEADLDVTDILVARVSDESIGPKLRAAKRAGIRRVVLEKKQQERARQDRRVPDGLDVVGADNLAQVYEALTGDARIERVIEAYCSRVCADWERAISDAMDMKHYVEPHYSLLAEGEDEGPLDSSQRLRLQRPGDDEPRGPSYHPVAGAGDSAEDELVKLMEASRRLCISEDAGAGKTVFTRRLQAFLCGHQGQTRLLGRRPYLVARFERRSFHWPGNFQDGLVDRLADLVRPDCGASERLAREVAEWALEHDRVVLILDALDQVDDGACVESLHELLIPGVEATPRVVLTCRAFAITRWQELFRNRGWRHGRIEGFTGRQQYLCLWDVLDREREKPATETECPDEELCRVILEGLVANYKEVEDLLRVPQVLAHIRQLHAEGRLRPFRSRGDLYQQVEQAVLEAAAQRMLGAAPHAGQIRQWRRLMAAAAFEMMARKTHYDYSATGDEAVDVQEAASGRCGSPYDPKQWREIEQVSECTNRQLVEGSTEDFFGFKHRGAMEYYCALHLVDNREPGWVLRATDQEIAAGQPPVRCGDPKLGEVAADDNWEWVFRFAIELATRAPIARDARARPSARVSPNSERTLAALAELFLARGRGRRPTELIYRAWHLFEVDPLVLRPMGLTPEQGRELVLPGAAQVVAHYRRREGSAAEIIENLIQNGFSRCPRDSGDDRKPFQMGSLEGEGYDSEHPQHAVTVQPFQMQTTQVTRAQYRVFDPEHERVKAERLDEYSPRDDSPVIYVSWYDAFAFAKWLGSGYGLPTEAEWEYACRAGSTTKYCFGDTESELAEYAWCDANSQRITHPVGKKKPNGWGLYDMHGNVWEWCWDWYGEYGAGPESDPLGPETGSYRVHRGGSWRDDAGYCRSARRDYFTPGDELYLLGFRVSRVPAEQESGE